MVYLEVVKMNYMKVREPKREENGVPVNVIASIRFIVVGQVGYEEYNLSQHHEKGNGAVSTKWKAGEKYQGSV